MNCWDLTRAFYSQVFDLELKHYYLDEPKDRSETQDLIYTNKGDVVKVQTPKFGDLVILRILGLESHIAVYLGEGRILHTSKRQGSVIDRLAKWDKVIVGYFRFPGEAQ